MKNLGGLLYFTDGKGIYPKKRPEYKTAFLFLDDYDESAVPPWAMDSGWNRRIFWQRRQGETMNIKQAKEEIKHTVQAYLSKDAFGEYKIPAVRQRPVLLIGPPGIGKTQIMEQIARECEIGLVAYTITHHTRQSAVGLPFIKEEQYDGKTYSVTEYTMSEIIASVYRKIEEGGRKEGILLLTRSTAFLRR